MAWTKKEILADRMDLQTAYGNWFAAGLENYAGASEDTKAEEAALRQKLTSVVGKIHEKLEKDPPPVGLLVALTPIAGSILEKLAELY